MKSNRRSTLLGKISLCVGALLVIGPVAFVTIWMANYDTIGDLHPTFGVVMQIAFFAGLIALILSGTLFGFARLRKAE